MSKIAALILAAGQSKRFTSEAAATKVVAELSGTPLVRRVAEAALASRAHPVIVVTGHAAADTSAALENCDVRIVHAADHAAGLSHSLRKGLAAVPGDAAGAVVLLADMPFVSAMLIDGLIGVYERTGRPTAVVPTYAGRRGNPVLLGRKIFAALARLEGDRGAAQILKEAEGVVAWPVDDASIVADIDTAEDLRRLSANRPRGR